MPRPLKLTADWFQHDHDMRKDPKVLAVRRKFGHEGYSIWCMTLEMLADSRGFSMSKTPEDIELVAADFNIDPEKLLEIWAYCTKLGLLQQDEERKQLWSRRQQERFSTLITQREQDNRYRKLRKEVVIGADNKEDIGTENPPRKGLSVPITRLEEVFGTDNISPSYSPSRLEERRGEERRGEYEGGGGGTGRDSPPSSAAAALTAAPPSVGDVLPLFVRVNPHASVEPNDEPALNALLALHGAGAVVAAYRMQQQHRPGRSVHWFVVDFARYRSMAAEQSPAILPIPSSMEERRAEREREEQEHPELLAEAQVKAEALKAKMHAAPSTDADDWEATAPGEAGP